MNTRIAASRIVQSAGLQITALPAAAHCDRFMLQADLAGGFNDEQKCHHSNRSGIQTF
jgi:hypothetical protein